jgi:hypothetical protein
VSEKLSTINNHFVWQIDFYPNGRDSRSTGKVVVVAKLITIGDKQTDALESGVEAEIKYTVVIFRQFARISPQNRRFKGRIAPTASKVIRSYTPFIPRCCAVIP